MSAGNDVKGPPAITVRWERPPSGLERLSIRTERIVREQGVETLEQLQAMSTADLVRCFGRKSMTEIVCCVHDARLGVTRAYVPDREVGKSRFGEVSK